MAYTVLSMGKEGKIKSFQKLRACASHNARMLYGENYKNIDNADPEYDDYNQDLMPMFKGQSYTPFEEIENKSSYEGFNLCKKWNERTAGLDNIKISRGRTNLALEFVVSFSHSATDNISLSDWKKANIDWINNTFNVAPDGKNNCISAILHNDERTPHIHFIVVPIDEDGKLNSQRWIKGREKFTKLRESYDKAMESLGLNRSISRSRASKVDLPHLYKMLQDNKDLPEMRENESIHDYNDRVTEYFRERNASELLKIKEAEDESLRNISKSFEDQRKELELEFERKRSSIPKDIKRMEFHKNALNNELANITEDINMQNELLRQTREQLQKQEDIKRDAEKYKRLKEIREYYRSDPVANEMFENVIELINGYDDTLQRELERLDELEEIDNNFEYDEVNYDPAV